MYRRPSKKREIIMHVITYTAMTLSVLAIVTVLIFLILGYKLDTNNGHIEQGALLQFNSTPGSATVTVDGQKLGTTSTKTTVLAGTHSFTMQRDGYKTWNKTLDVTAGTLTWLDYVRLVPINHSAKSVATYTTIAGSLATEDGKIMIVQQSASVPTFQVVDLSSDTVRTTAVTIPAAAYSEATTADTAHTFIMTSWDDGDRYVIVKHTYGTNTEWLVLDTQNSNATKNITNLFNLTINHVVFSGTSGNILYALSGSDIHQIDLSASTFSRTLVTNVQSFELFDTNIITYAGTDPSDLAKTVVGVYREGDSSAHILRSITTTPNQPIHITTTRFYNQDYVAISEGAQVDILDGSYPSDGGKNNSLVPFGSFTFKSAVQSMSFSPRGDYLLVQSGAQLASYDIDHERLTNYIVTTDAQYTVSPALWLDNDHTWSDFDGTLTMREFDGANVSPLNQVVAGQAVSLSDNGTYIYSINKSAGGYQLQRVLMILH
jgi:hypothetical protein